MRNLLTLDLAAMERDIKTALKKAAKEVADNMAEPTKQWSPDHTPDFGVVGPTVEGSDLVAFGGVLPGQGEKAQVYLWVTRGTKPHDIYARNAPTLLYPSPYYASTTRRSWSSKKASAGETWNVRQHTYHPGVAAREFEEKAAEEARQTLEDNVRAAVAGLFTGGQRWVEW